MRHLVFIFGDQLNTKISSLRGFKAAEDHILMSEVWQEATHVRHHQKKLVFIFSAMRHFAAELKQQGYPITYWQFPKTHHDSFTAALQAGLKKLKPEKIVVTAPSEYRVLQQVQSWQEDFGLPVEIRADDRFLCSDSTFQSWAKSRKSLTMEYFYRWMRKEHDILMDGEAPVGGQWNYDKENRKTLPKEVTIPAVNRFELDDTTARVIKLVKKQFSEHFGQCDDFHYAVTRAEALQALKFFVQQLLPFYGDYQDAMLQSQPWLFHSVLSHYINIGLLLPRECIQAVEKAYNQGKVPLNAAEGYIRQILGWREYVRGIYWLKMPEYKNLNALQAKRQLPAFFWDGNTDMNCLKQCINETAANAYAHHIQRLMVLGNFCLLYGVDPRYVNEWYLVVYADAYEWVELPNVSGMILYADGGLLGSKPYAASGAYINKMSNYCRGCVYDVKTKHGAKACPFNYLYWDFVAEHEERLADNQRMRMIYSTWRKMAPAKQKQCRQDAKNFRARIEGDK